MAAGILLLAAALCIGISNLTEARRAADSAKNLVQSIGEMILENGAQGIGDYALTPEMEMPSLEIDGNRYIGIVKVPSQSLALPVMSQWSYPKLKLSPCRFSGSVYLNDMIIIAHNYPKHFGNLRNLEPGDEVVFTDVVGNDFTYAVAELEQLGSMDIDELNKGQWDLTLVTCTSDGQRRVTVRCKRIENKDR